MFSFSDNVQLFKSFDPDSPDANPTEVGIIKDRTSIYKNFRRSLSSINFNLPEAEDLWNEEGPIDKRLQSIKALMKTEFTYLTRIKELLTDIFNIFLTHYDRLGKRHIIYQVGCLMDNFPRIFELHCLLHIKMKEKLKGSLEIGDLLFQFLSQGTVLEVYRNYVENFATSLDICRAIKERKFFVQHSEMMGLEAIIMSPVQRFPQLSMAIGDIYKYTPDSHIDKVLLHRALSISKSITARLDMQRREFEYTNFSFMESSLLKFKLPFSSTLLLSNNSVFNIRTDFHIPRRTIKIPYYLILCDQNVVLLPREVTLNDLTDKMTFCYPLEEVSFKLNVISSFRDQNNSFVDFDEVKDLYNLTNDSFSDDVVISEYKELLNDYKVLTKINEDLKQLSFHYKGLDSLKISRSLIKLEHQLKSKEMELNLQLGAILIMTIKGANALVEKQVFLFDSMRQSNEWKVMFNRTKLLTNSIMAVSWKYVSFGKKLPQLRVKELPWMFEPFILKDNGLVDIPSGMVIAQSVVLVIGLKITRCLWVCLSNGWVIILHFDNKHWMLMESFRIQNSRSVRSVCVTGSSNISSPDHKYDTEIWMACGDKILIHSLLDDQRATLKSTLYLPSEIESMCYVDNQVLVVLRSKKVFVYAKCQAPFWLQENEFSFKRNVSSFADKIQGTFHGHNMVYFIFERKIIVFKRTEKRFSLLNTFESSSDITAFTVSSEGVWVSTKNPIQLIMYDKLLNHTFQTAAIPTLFCQTHFVGPITSMFISERYAWLGTENGLIMCISTVDVLYCVDNKIPMYFVTTCSVGPVSQIILFQNIHGINVRFNPEDFAYEKVSFDQRIPHFRRSLSNSLLEERHHQYSLSCQNIMHIAKGCKDDFESSSSSSLQGAIENLKNTTPLLILAFGSGIAKYLDSSGEQECVAAIEKLNESTLFTFLE